MNQVKGIALAIFVVVAASYLQLYARTPSDRITNVDLATLLGEHQDATEKGPDSLKEFTAKWGGKKLLVNGYIMQIGPWGTYELGTTPDERSATVALFFPGREWFKGDAQKGSWVTVQCRSIALDATHMLFTDSVFIKIDRPEIR